MQGGAARTHRPGNHFVQDRAGLDYSEITSLFPALLRRNALMVQHIYITLSQHLKERGRTNAVFKTEYGRPLQISI